MRALLHRPSILLATLCGLAALAIAPSVGAAAPVGDVVEYTAGLSDGAFPAAVTAGVDGNVWFSDRGTQGAVIQANPTTGKLTEFSTGINAGASPRVIAQGPDGNFWVADGGTLHPGIVRITPLGAITEFDLPAGSSPDGVVAGPDGNVWFMDRGTRPAVGRITTDGTISTFPLPNAGASPHAITVGPDGNLWFADPGKTPAIGRVTIGSTVTVVEFSDGLKVGSLPDAIVAGPDGNLWFTDIGSTKAVGRITTDAKITEFTTGLNMGGSPRGITAGPDGSLWFTDQAPGAGAIGQITTDGTITERSAGLSQGAIPFRIATGPDGNLWFSDMGPMKAVGRFGVGAPAALVTPVSVTGGGAEGVAQSCGGAVWSSWASTQPSSSYFPFDGYRWLLDGTAIPGATTATYTPTPADVGHDLTCRLTVTYPLLTVTEQTSATVAVRDLTAPVLALPAPITVDATGPSGARIAFSATATDNVDAHPVVSCTPVSATTFPIGTTSVHCSATDTAGNRASGSFSVTVLGAAQQLAALQAAIHAVGPRARSLELEVVVARTFLALGQRRLACVTLTGFAAEVRAQSGRTIPTGTAAALVASARRIQSVLGC